MSTKKKPAREEPRSGQPVAGLPAGECQFTPEQTFYHSETGRFLVDVGTHYRCYSRRTPVRAGLARWFAERKSDDPDEDAKAALAAIELDRAVDWVGSIAGHLRGLHRIDGQAFLVPDQPNLPHPVKGAFPTITSILDQAFGADGEQLEVFLGWLAHGCEAVRLGQHSPAPMLVLAGPAGAGKSLIAELVVGGSLGGRIANPHVAWTGLLPWNDDLVGSELLLIDDSVASTDRRARREFAARFKEAIYAPKVRLMKRNHSSISLRPVWRVLVCCNEAPDDLRIIPPIDEGLGDKVAMLRVAPVKLDFDCSTAAGKRALQQTVAAELPAFAQALDKYRAPKELADTRSGVRAWRHPDLERAIWELCEEAILGELLQTAFQHGILEGPEVTITAAELERKLKGSSLQGQCNGLLKYPSACGSYLARLAQAHSTQEGANPPPAVERGTVVHGQQRWRLRQLPDRDGQGGGGWGTLGYS